MIWISQSDSTNLRAAARSPLNIDRDRDTSSFSKYCRLATSKQTMQITIEIPDQIAHRLNQTWGSLSNRLLEMVVADAYCCGEMSTAEVQQILQLPSRLETHAFLKRMNVYLNYDEAELEQDLQTLRKIRGR